MNLTSIPESKDTRNWPKPNQAFPALVAIGYKENAIINPPEELMTWMDEFCLGAEDVIDNLPEEEGIYQGVITFLYSPGAEWWIDDNSRFVFSNPAKVEIP